MAAERGQWKTNRGGRAGKGGSRGPGSTNAYDDEHTRDEMVRDEMVRQDNLRREPNLRGYPQANNPLQKYTFRNMFKFECPWGINDPRLPRDWWDRQRQKHNRPEEDGDGTKISTRGTRNGFPLFTYVAMGPHALEVLNAVIRDMGKYIPQC